MNIKSLFCNHAYKTVSTEYLGEYPSQVPGIVYKQYARHLVCLKCGKKEIDCHEYPDDATNKVK